NNPDRAWRSRGPELQSRRDPLGMSKPELDKRAGRTRGKPRRTARDSGPVESQSPGQAMIPWLGKRTNRCRAGPASAPSAWQAAYPPVPLWLSPRTKARAGCAYKQGKTIPEEAARSLVAGRETRRPT